MLTALSRAFGKDATSPFAGLFATEALKSHAAGTAIITRKHARERAALGQQLQDPLRVGCGMAMAQVPGAPVMKGMGVARCLEMDGISVPAFSVSGGTGDFLAVPVEGQGLSLCRLAPGRQMGERLAAVSEAQLTRVLEALESYRADVALQLILMRIAQGGTMPGLVVLGEAPDSGDSPRVRVRVMGKRADWIATLHAKGAMLHDLDGEKLDEVTNDDILSHAEVLAQV